MRLTRNNVTCNDTLVGKTYGAPRSAAPAQHSASLESPFRPPLKHPVEAQLHHCLALIVRKGPRVFCPPCLFLQRTRQLKTFASIDVNKILVSLFVDIHTTGMTEISRVRDKFLSMTRMSMSGSISRLTHKQQTDRPTHRQQTYTQILKGIVCGRRVEVPKYPAKYTAEHFCSWRWCERPFPP